MARRRPWRAVAWVPDATAPNGRQRLCGGRTAAVTRDGLDRFIESHEGMGQVVEVIEVLDIPGVIV